MPTPRILAFAGSVRRDSFNKRLIRIAAQAAERAGAHVTLIDLADYPLPLFTQDDEAEHGLPANALAVKKLFFEHHGLLISSPEYNSSISPLLKNTIDWVSRSVPGEESLTAYQGKVAALLSASPGKLGGLRGLVHLRSILGNIGVLVLPDQMAVPEAQNAFDDDGRLKHEKMHASVERVGQLLVELTTKLL